jgi:hypothetical protein
VLQCALTTRIESGRARDAGEGRRRHPDRKQRRWGRLEVREGADMWAPPVGDHMREREGSGRWRACWARSGELGRDGEKKEGGPRVGFGVR